MLPSAFDAFAADYDAAFTHSPLGQLLRRRVWRVLADYFQAGQTVLELACGTGEDAVWLAQRGVSVTATDGSAEMVKATAVKAQQNNLSDHITPLQLSLQAIAEERIAYCVLRNSTQYAIRNTQYDGAFSNFGGLNTLSEWRPLAAALARLVRPGGHLVLVPMGPVCPWEIGWYGLHGQWKTAVRRWRQPATARIGHSLIPVWYPSARRLRQDFAPWFECVHVESLGLWLPPSTLAPWVERRPRLFAALNRLEDKTARLSPGWGDHYIMVLGRRESSPYNNGLDD
ncbi:MAG: class I SAM-dependent methyltransferase [Chloroflexota bacterium]